MPLVVLGLNHKTAPVELRERVVFAPQNLPEVLGSLTQRGLAREAVIVSTCNRTEIYAVTADARALQTWLEQTHELNLSQALYVHVDADAIAHAFGVAAGLDSLILGEPQILGQLKTAYRTAQGVGSVGPGLNRLFQTTFAVAKRIRSETPIGAHSLSVAAAAVSLARQVFSGFSQHTALLVGAGETIALTARHLHSQQLKRLLIANRSLERAQSLSLEFNAAAIPLANVAAHLHEADLIVTATASPTPIIWAKDVAAALAKRRHKPMLMIDLAIPRDIDPAVGAFEDVYLYGVDDLNSLIEANLKVREQGAKEARALIAEELARYASGSRLQQAVPTIIELRERAEALKSHTLAEANRQLSQGRDPTEVLSFLADTLTHRIIHAPTHALRQASEQADGSLLAAARELFDLDQDSE
jgi:glutamyl-tRNA reductase